MVDTKRLKEVTFAASAATPGSFPSPVVDGSPVSLAASGEGILYTAIVTDDGTLALSIITDNAAAPATPVGVFIEGIFRSTLPTYTTGDASIAHFDSRGRLLTTLSNPTSGDVIDISVDDSAAPTNPVGTWQLAKFTSTAPTLTNNDASVLHTDSRGRLLTVMSNPTTGDSVDVSTDDAAAPANPVGTWQLSKFTSTAPTLANGDASVLHADSRGRLITVLSNPTTGDVIDVTADDAAAPANPIGTWPLAKFTSTAPTLTTGDASILHVNDAGRLHIENDYPSTAAVTSVAASASSVSLLASNVDRRGATFYNDSASATLFLKFGTTASTSSYTAQLAAGAYYEVPYPIYTGAIDGIWSAAVGNCRITQITK